MYVQCTLDTDKRQPILIEYTNSFKLMAKKYIEIFKSNQKSEIKYTFTPSIVYYYNRHNATKKKIHMKLKIIHVLV